MSAMKPANEKLLVRLFLRWLSDTKVKEPARWHSGAGKALRDALYTIKRWKNAPRGDHSAFAAAIGNTISENARDRALDEIEEALGTEATNEIRDKLDVLKSRKRT